MVKTKKDINWDLVSKGTGLPRRYVEYLMDSGKIPYKKLFQDMRAYPHTRKEAMIVIRRQAPSEIAPWLNYVEVNEEWSSLFLCLASEDEETERRLLYAAAKWLESQQSDSDGGDETGGGWSYKPI